VAALDEGVRIAFEVKSNGRGPSAVAVTLLTDETAAEPAGRVIVSDSDDPFAALGLNDALLRAVADAGYETPTPIQIQAIPDALTGRDVLGCAQTGTGKTASFALPILQRLSANYGGPRRGHRPIRALILAPTRELAIQIDDSFSGYGKHSGLRNTVIYGGVGQNPQVAALRRGVDILTATPGRLLDLIGQGYVKLDQVEAFVLDEVDRMMDMGFIHDVRRVIKLVPQQRQTLLFSATMPRDIVKLAATILHNPLKVTVTPEKPAVEAIEQSVYFVGKKQKQFLLEYVLSDKSVTRALVFTRTKHGANKVVKKLVRAGISAAPIHGNKSQSARQRSLQSFRDGTTRVLVATDVVARGIDVEEISHVIQFDLPNVSEDYVHRIGRTGRAGAAGMAVSFCDEDERPFLRDIEKLLRKRIPVVVNHPFSR
jgi:ATP-dependent RNA helicase RhlE